MGAQPKYKIIEQDILDAIQSGQYAKDDLIPTEHEFAKKYNVSRVTVRNATDNLVTLGYLYRIPGSGTYVAKTTITKTATKPISFHKEMEALNKTVLNKVVKFEIQEASPTISSILNIPEKSLVYYIERIRYGNDTPYMYEHSYIPTSFFTDLSLQDLGISKYAYFERKGMKVDHSDQTLIPILADKKYQEVFHLEEHTALIKVENIIYSETSQIIDYTIDIINPKVYQVKLIKYH